MQVGQELFYVSLRASSGQIVVVTRVGRKWADVVPKGFKNAKPRRININSMQADGGAYSSPGRCYLSEYAYKEEIELWKAWQKFRREVAHMTSTPSAASLQAAADILGINLWAR